MPGRKVVIVGEAYDPTLSVGWPLPPGGEGGQPPGIWPSPGVPTHPIVLPPEGGGGTPPGIWPPGSGIELPTHPIVIPPDFVSPGVPTHPIVIPPTPPVIWPSPGHPAHPIVLPPPDSGLKPTHPIVIPPGGIDGIHPEHPIVIPPPQPPGSPSHPIYFPPEIWPSPGRPTHPIVIPPGEPGVPTHPIVIPPEGPPQVMDNWDVVAYWTPAGGWGTAIVPSGEHPGLPTPARREA